MKLFLIFQITHTNYDTYDSAVVVAKDENEARSIHPSGDGREVKEEVTLFNCWCALKDVQVEYLGEAKDGSERGVVCASFNAG